MDALNAVMDKVKNHPEVMEKVSAVMDKVKSHPEMVEKVKDEVKSLAETLHLRKHGKTCIFFLGLSLAERLKQLRS